LNLRIGRFIEEELDRLDKLDEMDGFSGAIFNNYING
jgi:hypothetical protein